MTAEMAFTTPRNELSSIMITTPFFGIQVTKISNLFLNRHGCQFCHTVLLIGHKEFHPIDLPCTARQAPNPHPPPPPRRPEHPYDAHYKLFD